MLQLTFNPGLTLTGFRTTRPMSLQLNRNTAAQGHLTVDVVKEFTFWWSNDMSCFQFLSQNFLKEIENMFP